MECTYLSLSAMPASDVIVLVYVDGIPLCSLLASEFYTNMGIKETHIVVKENIFPKFLLVIHILPVNSLRFFVRH